LLSDSFDKANITFDFPEPIPLTKTIKDILEKDVDEKYYYNGKPLYEKLKNDVKEEGQVYFHANKDMMPVRMDRIYLSRIFTNMITNAKQAVSEQRKSIINIDAELFNKKIIIVIEDNGIGIPKDKLEQIFEPNFTTKNSGMGLGLTMVKKMIEEYKGDISVKSEEGKGTKFTIILPTNV
jgi:signal transduction histidine kinase